MSWGPSGHAGLSETSLTAPWPSVLVKVEDLVELSCHLRPLAWHGGRCWVFTQTRPGHPLQGTDTPPWGEIHLIHISVNFLNRKRNTSVCSLFWDLHTWCVDCLASCLLANLLLAS